MDRALYCKYASYYIDKFKDYPNIKIDKKWPCENIMHIYISTDLPHFGFFMGIFPSMITFDGICICDDGIEFEDIETVDPDKVYKLFDKETASIKSFIKEGLFIFAYKNGKEVLAASLDEMNRKDFLEKLNIQEVYKSCKDSRDLLFEEVDHIELRDFYNDIIYTYNKQEN